MPDAINVYRGTPGTLPAAISNEILQKVKGASAVMQLARQIPLPGNGAVIPVITSDPAAAWVAETGKKAVATPGLSQKTMQAYKLAVIVPFSDEFKRDRAALYNALIERLPGALAQKFDQTVVGAVAKPGENFDNFAACTAQSLIAASNYTAYTGLVNAYSDIGAAGGSLDGFALSPAGKGVLLAAVDGNGRPLFINGATEGTPAVVLGEKVVEGRGIYKAGIAPANASDAGTPAIVGIAGDWSQALWGTVEGVQIKISDQTGLTIGSDQVNLWEHNMFAVRAEIEVGFVANTACFNLLTGATPQS